MHIFLIPDKREGVSATARCRVSVPANRRGASHGHVQALA